VVNPVDSSSFSASDGEGITPPEPSPSGERFQPAPGNPLLSQRLSRLTLETPPELELPALPTELDELQAQLQEARSSLVQWSRAETAWKGQRRLFKVVTEHVSDPLAVADAQGRRIWNNPAYARLLAPPTDNPSAAHLLSEVHPDDKAKAQAALDEALRTAQPREATFRVRRPDGGWADLQAKLIPLADSAGRTESIVLVGRDQSEKNRMAEALDLANRGAASAGVTDSMARDLDQVLTSALGNLSIARNLNGPQNAVAVRLNEIDRALQRARGMLDQLGTLSDHPDRALTRVSIEPLAQDVINGVLRGTLVRAEYLFSRRLPQPEIDPDALSLALRNIVTNSVQAMDRGVVRVSAEVLTPEKLARQAPPALKPGTYIHLSIQDQGHGMQERTLARAFEPAFTTRKGAQGLGLATALSALQRMGGALTAESTAGVGTTMRLFIPVPGDAATAADASAATAHTRRILLMDDEQMILDIVSRMLTHLGYEVSTSKDGAQAIAAFTKAKNKGEPFDVVMMDLVIPNGVGGQEAAPTLKQIDPHAKIIASSGHLDHPVMKDYRKYGFTAILEKPYKLERLQQVIGSVIEQGS
jgi:two-component system cell cycle sensor histidine kinase/response regulator CckA